MHFLNREQEKALITGELGKPDSRLIVLYGRRRIGKSALLRQVLDDQVVYYLADINEAQVQRSFFAAQVADMIPGFDQPVYLDWNTLLRQKNQMLKRQITVVIDEFPYLDTSSPELPSVIQKIIDLGQNSRFHLVLCGSSQQMMQGLVLDRSAPLFGRAHRIIQLQPMRCKWLLQALQIDPAAAIEEYSVWGGIPRYWELRSEYASLNEAIRELVLDPYGILHEEPLRLFMDDLRYAVQPFSISSLIGQGCNKLSEIAGRLNKPATSLNRPLQNMIATGYVKRDVCWGEKVKNSKKTLYRILDPLSRFFFTFVVPNQSKLSSGNVDLVMDEIKSRWKLHVSETWEELCRESVSHLEVDGHRFLPAQRWWQQSRKQGSAEIDLISESSDGSVLLVGEAKWKSRVRPESLLRDLDDKINCLDLSKKYDRVLKLLLLPGIKEKTEEDILWRNAEFVCSGPD
jgi:AAA+ ATPase superfamily predicted ATPase